VSRLTKKELQANSAPFEQLPTRADIARRYGVSLRTLDRWVAERRIPHIRLGKRCVRFRWEAVEKAIDRLVVKEVK
jgi:excisionase family DNA binding protein